MKCGLGSDQNFVMKWGYGHVTCDKKCFVCSQSALSINY